MLSDAHTVDMQEITDLLSCIIAQNAQVMVNNLIEYI